MRKLILTTAAVAAAIAGAFAAEPSFRTLGEANRIAPKKIPPSAHAEMYIINIPHPMNPNPKGGRYGDTDCN